ncbi:MAG: malto-oligosyltrehalose trehalohydrolase, partial [Magnetococcales bacterium]|nr:malto-oligosyltrehalose trehalohydrolase [Magnetococcales bacterium]
MPFGTCLEENGDTTFRLWAPTARGVDLCLESDNQERILPLESREDGWFSLTTDQAGVGSWYRFRVDGRQRVPDPASRFQPRDVHGPSCVVDPKAFVWHDADWRGRPWQETVIHELHVGTFSPRGDYRGVEASLQHLVDLGVTAIELMPLADFPGQHGWGYDGVLLFAPKSAYGSPEALKRLVDAAHAHGLMVFLDVVYNHFGPEGNYLHLYAPTFFHPRYHTPWGVAMNLAGASSHWVRQFFIHNALYWLNEYHMDGLRLDAVQAMIDDSVPHILHELATAVNTGPGAARHVHLILENDANTARFLRETNTCHATGGSIGEAPKEAETDRCQAQWNDDLHNALHHILTGESQGYYLDFQEKPLRHLGRALAEGFAFQGESSPYRDDHPRGEPSAQLPPTAFVSFLQNHDQVGNRLAADRLTTLIPPEALRAATTLILLAPQIPMLFMGQEWGCRQPFPFFCDL